MSDVSVTVSSNPIQVTTTSSSIEVTTSTLGGQGVQGNQGTQGIQGVPGTGINSINSLSGSAMFLSGVNNIFVSQSGTNTIFISGNTGDYSSYYSIQNISQFVTSGNLYDSGNLLNNRISSITEGTGNFYIAANEQRIRTSIPTGSGFLFISFNSNFSSRPLVFNNIETTGQYSYNTSISGLTNSGYFCQFSDLIRESGIILYTLAKIF